MSGSELAQLGATIVVGLLAFYAAVIKSKPSAPEGRSASAAEVVALGDRLDKQAARADAQDKKIEGLEKTNRALYAYIALDHAEHRKHGWKVVPLPEEIA